MECHSEYILHAYIHKDISIHTIIHQYIHIHMPVYMRVHAYKYTDTRIFIQRLRALDRTPMPAPTLPQAYMLIRPDL